MALVVKDRIKEVTTTTGTGTLTLAGAVTKFQSFSVVGDGNTTYYAIESGNGSDWEIGVGTYTASGTTLSRDTILESSNAGSAINLSGTSTVFCTYPAERSVNTEDIGTTIQAYDADTTKNDVANTFTANQTINADLTVDTDTLYVDSTNNRVGIGTSSPTAKLDLLTSGAANVALFRAGAGYNSFLSVIGNGNSFLSTSFDIVQNSSNQAELAQRANAPMVFYTNNTERMRIDSSGNVLVGNTAGYLTNAKLLAYNTNSGNGATMVVGSAWAGDVSTPAVLISKLDNNTTTSQVFTRFYINGSTACGQINANGASTAAFGTASDERLKENITDLPPQLNNIMSLRPTEFDYKDGSGHQIGFIAQEMQEVYPDVVSPDENNMLSITGWDKTSSRLVKAIQEQQAIIETLTTRIQALENK